MGASALHIVWTILLGAVAGLCTASLVSSDWISGSGSFAATIGSNSPQSRDVTCGVIFYCIVGEASLCNVGYGSFGDIPVEQWSTAASTVVLATVVIYVTFFASIAAMFGDNLSIILWSRHGPPIAGMCLFAGVAFTVTGLHDTAEGIGTDTLCHMCIGASSSSPGPNCSYGIGAIMLFVASGVNIIALIFGYLTTHGSVKVEPETID